MNIKIFQRDDYSYDFPQPAYGFGQILIDSENDEGFVVAMQYTAEEWEYQMFFTKLEVLGVEWFRESQLSTSVTDV